MSPWLNPKVEVRVSPIHGRGLFADAPIGPGEQLTVRGDTNYTVKNDADFQSYVSTAASWDAQALGGGMHRVSTVERDQEPTNLGNHSCTANATVNDRGLIALTDIAADEEITVDYSLVSSKAWTMRCNCRASNCRDVVRGVL